MPTAYQIETTRLLLPHLIRAAKRRETPTYGQLGNAIDRHHRTIPDVLGYIRDEICQPRDLPLINAIVVNKNSRLPGESFLPEGTSNLTPQQYRQRFQDLRDEVFAYAGWDDLLEELGLTPIRKTPEDLNEEGREYSKLLARRGGSGESEAHVLLKNYVADNPAILGLATHRPGITEFLFVSGDRCDAVFDLSPAGYAVVEVKDGEHAGELVRGIYQAIKYRALMMAEKGQGEEYPVRAFLVAYEIPSEIVNYARRFGVACKVIDSTSVKATAAVRN
jgi:hypothetical protein